MTDTPETDSKATNHIGFYSCATVPASLSRRLERERDDYKWQLHIAKGEIEEARQMERAWKKEETK